MTTNYNKGITTEYNNYLDYHLLPLITYIDNRKELHKISPETYFTYILYLFNNHYYTGITNNLNRRINEHEHKKTGYTSRFTKKQLIYVEKFTTRIEARKREVEIKKKGAYNTILIETLKFEIKTTERNNILLLLNKRNTCYININSK